MLDAAPLKNAVMSERAWVVTATFAQGKETLRFTLCKRWPKEVITTGSVRESGGFSVMTSFKKTRELLGGAYLADIISNEEFVLLYDCSFSENLELPYKEYERFDLEEMADSECLAEFRVNKHDLPHLPECLQIPAAFVCNQDSVCEGMEAVYATSKAFIPLQILGYDTKIWQTSPRVEYGDQQGS